MANSKISDLTTGNPVAATDSFVIARAGTNYKVTATDIWTVPSGSQILGTDGTAALPTYSFTSDGNSGFYLTGNALPGVSDEAALIMEWQATGTNVYSHAHIRAGSAKQYGWSSNATPTSAAADTGLGRNAAGIVGVTDGSTGLGYLKHGTPVTANTATATPAVTDSGILYSNTGDSDGSIITLPNDPTIGTTIEAFANVNQAITINVSAGETIQDGAVSGTSTVSSTQGAWMRLVAVTGGSGAIWGVCGKLGTWVTT